MVKLVVADMDGTLVNSRHELPADLFFRINQLKEREVRFAIASGRQYYNLEKIFQSISEEIIFIAENGAMVYDHGTCIYTDAMDYQDVESFVQTLRQHDSIVTVLCGSQSAYIENQDMDFYEHLCRFYERVEVVEDLLSAAMSDKICKIAVYNETSAEEVIYPLVQPMEDRFQLAVSGNFWLDIMKHGVDKGSGIRRIQKFYGITSKECMAFGDYLNDYEMMQVCDYSYAMANAHPKLKEICKYETESNDENGVMNELIRFFQL